jgi:lipoate-protein ligase A
MQKLLEVIDSKKASAEMNMSLDEKIFSQMDAKDRPILHFYDWEKKSITYGYFSKPKDFIDFEQLEKHEMQIAKRPTGGGIVFHIWDFAFSFFMPSNHSGFSSNTLKNYFFVNSCVFEGIKEFIPICKNAFITKEDFLSENKDCMNFCMARPTKYDIIYKGKKIVGAAQRRKANGYLHQGTISMVLPDRTILNNLLQSNSQLIESFFSYTYPLLGEKVAHSQFIKAKKEIKYLLEKQFQKKLSNL